MRAYKAKRMGMLSACGNKGCSGCGSSWWLRSSLFQYRSLCHYRFTRNQCSQFREIRCFFHECVAPLPFCWRLYFCVFGASPFFTLIEFVLRLFGRVCLKAVRKGVSIHHKVGMPKKGGLF